MNKHLKNIKHFLFNYSVLIVIFAVLLFQTSISFGFALPPYD